MEHRPIGIASQKATETLPATGFTMFLQHQQGVIGGAIQSPAAVPIPRQTHESMQKVVAGIRVGFDVIEQHPGSIHQFRQCGRRRQQRLHLSIPLRPSLSHQRCRHRAVLFAEVLQLRFQCDWVRIGQRLQAVDPEIEKHVPALGADSADLTEVSLPTGFGIADTPPTAEGAFAPISRQWWRRRPFQVGRQLAQGFIQLALQAVTQSNRFLFQAPTRASESQAMGHRSLLKIRQQTGRERQLQAMLACEASPLAGQHRPVAVITPSALA